MKVAFRTDASLLAGSGHVMRCLSLADALKARGAQCRFVSREHAGHLNELARQRGFEVLALPPVLSAAQASTNLTGEPAHVGWLGCNWQLDVEQTAACLNGWQPDWLVVDHYSLDRSWEMAMRPHCSRLMVIDDLADRAHDCDLLLDQNLRRSPQDYAGLVPVRCTLMVGAQYALLRGEFADARAWSLERRESAQLKRLLVTMGGVDKPNATGAVLDALGQCQLPGDCAITVIMGGQALWLDRVRTQAQQMPCATEVLVNIGDMAARMCESDLAIGAAGMTSWERCCLGLPALIVVLAANQWPGARALEGAGAARLLGEVSDIRGRLSVELAALVDGARLARMTAAASAVTDGRGIKRVIDVLGAQA